MSAESSPRGRRSFFQRGALAIVAGCLCWAWPAAADAQLGTRAVPNASYFLNLGGNFERGNYPDALRGFQGDWQSGIKNGNTRWVDSICYHAMMGECYYQQGDYVDALQQFNAASNLWAFHSTWMLKVQWPGAPRAAGAMPANQLPPWGQSTRNRQFAVYQDTYSVQQGTIDPTAVIQKGGVVQMAILYPVNVIEICRCVTLTARRRRELLGPLAPFDKTSAELVAALSGPSTSAGNWSQCFVDVMHGCALSAAGKDGAAKGVLERGVVAGGQYDHPLTGVALFELGRIELTAGNYAAAAGRFEEATYAAHHVNDGHLLEEAFRFFCLAHSMSGKGANYGAALATAITWSGPRKSETLTAGLAVLSAEAFSNAKDFRSAGAALSIAAKAMARNTLSTGRVGARFNYISALLAYQQGNGADGDAALLRALAFQSTGSMWVFHIALVDEWFKSGLLSEREAFDVYRTVLREPTSADWLSNPMESITTLLTPHSAQLETWFHIALKRKEDEAAIDISDMVRRHRFFNSQSIGGRLLALRWVLDGPEESLPQEVKLQRQEILAAYPAYDDARKAAEALRIQIEAKPIIAANSEQLVAEQKLFEQYTSAVGRQEIVLKEIALRRQPCEMVFPPRRKVEDVQRALGPKTACMAYFVASGLLYACTISEKGVSITQIPKAFGARDSVHQNVESLLKDWGNINAQRQINATVLAETKWRKTVASLTQSLLHTGRTDFPSGFEELVIVPEGILWYLPFEVLGLSDRPVEGGDNNANDKPLVAKMRIRYAPTIGLAIPSGRRRRPLPSTLLAVGRIYAQDKAGLTEAAAAEFLNSVPLSLPVDVRTPLAGNPSVFTSFFDRVVTYDDVTTGSGGPFSFNLLPWTRGWLGSDMGSLLNLPWTGPTQVVLPGFHSAAESAGVGANGNDLFLASCGLMASGAETVVLSRWRTGGQTSFDIVREFVSELDHSSPADAWQRAVLLAMSNPVDLAKEPRIQGGGTAPPGSHPFFWAGGMLFDSGDPTPGALSPTDDGVAAKLKEKQRLLEEAQKRLKDAQDAAGNNGPAPEPPKPADVKPDMLAPAPAADAPGEGEKPAAPARRPRPTRRNDANKPDPAKPDASAPDVDKPAPRKAG